MKKQKKILVAGGYGYKNTGDEAQCNETLRLLTERYPDYQIINLSPNPDYSKTMHPEYFHDTASRTAFFDEGLKVNIFREIFLPLFFIKAILVLINAIFVKYNLPTLLINSKTSKLLQQLKEASLFYFCGGGYLTGKTLTRLYDGILLCKLCKIFNTPVVMSGQTIGLWGNKFNEILAKWGFKNVNVITVRDEEFSLNDLSKIGLKGENYFVTHDDALFCKKSAEKQVDLNNYIVLNFHYWGMQEKQKIEYIDKINKIIKFIIEKTNCTIVFIPMTPSDKKSYEDYIKKYPNDKILFFDYDFDFKKIRRVISDSKFCITMKHHPIIFAMGENIPTISLAFSSYYFHKNVGALAQYKQNKYSVNLEDDNYYNIFTDLFDYLNNNKDIEIQKIIQQTQILSDRKETFLKQVDEILIRN